MQLAANSAIGAPDVTYHGRWSTSGASAICAWPMSAFSVSTNGSAVTATLTPGADGARLKVVVDGSDHGYVTLAAGAGRRSYTLASGLSAGSWHEVSTYKVSEDNTFKGTEGALKLHAVTSSNGEIRRTKPRGGAKPRRLEFIGDSDTAGWCADGKPKGSDRCMGSGGVQPRASGKTVAHPSRARRTAARSSTRTRTRRGPRSWPARCAPRPPPHRPCSPSLPPPCTATAPPPLRGARCGAPPPHRHRRGERGAAATAGSPLAPPMHRRSLSTNAVPAAAR